MLANILAGAIEEIGGAEGRMGSAAALYERAEQQAAAVDMRLHVAAARRARGRVTGDKALVTDADARFAAEHIRNGEAYARVIVPH